MLDSVPLTSLLSLFELDRMTGVLSLRRAGEQAQLWVDRGRVVDAEPGPDPRATLRALLNCGIMG